MDITYYFKKNVNHNYKFSHKTADQKAILTTKYLSCLAKLINTQAIDILEYTHLINFMKTGGTIVNLGRFDQIFNKIKKDGKIDNEAKNNFINVSKQLFGHLLELFRIDDLDYIGEEQINIDNILKKLQEYSKEEIIFTNDQKEAIIKICNFLLNPEMKTFGLYGFAGTGKTTVVTKLIHFLIYKNYLNSVVFSAPTNKAVNIIKSKFRNNIEALLKEKHIEETNSSFDEQLGILDEKGYKINFFTIHKLLNYQNDFDVDGSRIFIKSDKSNLNKYDLIVIDECSMISMQIIAHIFEEIRNEIKIMGKDSIVKKVPKILFVGDPAQLNPINEKVSIIFSKNAKDFDLNLFSKLMNETDSFFEKNPNINVKKRMELLSDEILSQKSITMTAIVRSNDNDVVGLCNEVRKWVFNIIKEPKIGLFQGKKVKIYKYDNSINKIHSGWFKKCVEYFKNMQNKTLSNISLTWTNFQSDEYNLNIRKQLFNKEILNEFEIGDILILKDFYNIKETSIEEPLKDNTNNAINTNNTINTDNAKNKRFYTSEQIRVVEIEEVTKVSPEFNTNPRNQAKKIEYFKLIEDKFKKAINFINKSTYRRYNVWKLHVIRLVDGTIQNTPMEYILYVVKKESFDQLENDKKISADKIKELRRFFSGNFKDQIDRIDLEIIKPLWRQWNLRFWEPYAEVNVAASISVHKSQGSSYYNVFIDADDILRNPNSNEGKRCIYTALTRTSNELHILI